MRALILLGLFGCDAVYGLSGRKDPDAAPSGDVANDATTDGGGATCPTSGPPMFTPTPVLILTNCKGYTTSVPMNRALVSCTGIYESAIGTSDKTAAIINAQTDQVLDDPRIAPEGDQMFVTSRDTQTGLTSIQIYRRARGRWEHGSSPSTFPTTATSTVLLASTPSVATLSSRHVIIHHQVVNTPTFSEFVDNAGTWSNVHDYTADDFGMATFAFPSLTPDGLHLVFAGNPTVGAASEIRYAFRASIDDTFDTSVKIDVGADAVLYPHLAPDCSRLYFTALNQVQYVEP